MALSNSPTNGVPSVASAETPVASVIIPAHNSESFLRRCLGHLAQTQDCPYEVIVVDDRSTDATADVAEEFGAQTVLLEQHFGPAVARNLGAEKARGKILVFIDSDVFVTSNTIASLVTLLRDNPEYDAVIGSYDAQPTAQNLVSQYKNLLHHFTHQRAQVEAFTFWSGCGAVRTERFAELGGFDARFTRPCIEDIEFGTRLKKAGGRIRLAPEIQVKHAKQWRLTSLVKTDFFDRALPWTRLLLDNRNMPNDLNLSLSQRLCVLTVALLSIWILFALWWEPLILLLLSVSLLFVLAVDRIEDTSWHRNGTRLAALLLISCFLALAPATPISSLVIAITLGVTLSLNAELLKFLAQRRGWTFATMSMLLHVLYYFYSGAGFLTGCVQHLWHGTSPRKLRDRLAANVHAHDVSPGASR